MPEIDEHNFGYNNPNFVNGIIVDNELLNAVSFVDDSTSDILTPTSKAASDSSSPSSDDDDAAADDEKRLKNVNKSDQRRELDDETQNIKRNASAQQLNNVKRRSTYAKLGAADMGVPHSPTCDDVDRLKNDEEEINISSVVLPLDNDNDVVDSPTTCQRRRTKSSSDLLNAADDDDDDERIYEVDNNTYFNRSAQSPPIDGVEREINFEHFTKVLDDEKELLLTNETDPTMMHNGNGHHAFFGQDRGVDDVDESPQDFRRNLAMIDQVAREGGAFYPGGGIKMRREGDTTIVTEHRDPYSFYWQLDKIRKQQEDAAAAPKQEILDNAIDEVIAEESTQIQSPDSHDSGIHVEYSRPSKPVKKLSERFLVTPPAVAREESPQRTKLPPGWEKHEDPKGFSYYWHVDSGTVQREPPKASIERVAQSEPPRQMIDRGINAQPPMVVQASPALPPQQPVIVERAFKQTTTKRRVENESADDREIGGGGGATTTTTELVDGMKLPVRFAVRSLGWTEISEDDLTQERSSRAVNKAIVDLSTGRNDLIDNVSKWGDGKELIMELDDHDLRLIDPDSGTMLHTQPIHQIRVWGVGRDNGRDFAYVARDRNTRRFMCHVFRCDTPARTIANTLRDICKRLMLERRPNSLQTSNVSSSDNHRKHQLHQHHQQQPSNYGDMPHSSSFGSRSFSRDSFPTPMEEPKKIIRCHFLGVTQVPKATGIEILNEAVDRLVAQVRTERWILCDVSIAPSTITINEVSGNQIAECRVRYLSFLGIGRDVKHCAFIMQTSSDSFMCYVFHVEPSAGAMAKTIEAACKLRYQKVLDAHGERRSSSSQRGWGDTIRDVFGSFTGRRSGRSSSQYPR